jgi:hypothetical protein
MPHRDLTLTARALEEPVKPKATATVMGVFLMVKYDYRKTPDLYVAVKGNPVKCCQCEAEFPVAEFQEHVMKFYRKAHKEVH